MQKKARLERRTVDLDNQEVFHYCDFCGKQEDFVNLIIVGTKADICDECVVVCVGVIAAAEQKKPAD